jgi:cyclic pyranopterin phosphate synthase
MLPDSFGRIATDLRVSLTDRCNLRCAYCMPPEGLDWLPSPELLTDDEVMRLIGVAVERLGIREVRFTGGEPLLRRGLAGIVARTAALRPRPEISLTTNAIGLKRSAGALHEAGLDRINVSLDTLRPETFRKLARRDRLPDVLDGLAAAAEAGLTPVKVNAVLMRDLNDDEAAPLLRFCLDHGYELRFIEQMPLDAQHGWKRAEMITADEIFAVLSREFALTPDDPGRRGSAPAETFLVDGGPAKVGVIASVTRPFCGSCDRVRLTADGQVRNCLFARTESDLRGPLRAGASDAELAGRWQRAVAVKLPGHGINDPSFLQPDRPMSAIGGLPRERCQPGLTAAEDNPAPSELMTPGDLSGWSAAGWTAALSDRSRRSPGCRGRQGQARRRCSRRRRGRT